MRNNQLHQCQQHLQLPQHVLQNTIEGDQMKNSWGPLLQPPISTSKNNRRVSSNIIQHQQQPITAIQHFHHQQQQITSSSSSLPSSIYSSHDNILSNFSSQNSAFKLIKDQQQQEEEEEFYNNNSNSKILLIPPDKQRPFNLLHMTTLGLKNTFSSIKYKSNISQIIDVNKSTSSLKASSSSDLNGSNNGSGINSDEFPLHYFTDNDSEGSIILPQHKHVRKWPLLFRRFKFVSLLGQGRFSKVVLCEDLFQSNRRVAIKIMNQKSNEIGLQESLHYFNIQNNSNNNNSNILQLHLTFYFCGHFCLVFEELGETLLNYIQRFQPFTIKLETLKKIALQLIIGLLTLKQSNIIHTDLKPENILMKKTNSSKLKIADFGNAINYLDKYHLNLNVGRQLQTLFYRSPEVIFGNSIIDFQMDMWSIGCILVECFIGNPLFNSNNLNQLINQMITLLGPLPLNLFKNNNLNNSNSNTNNLNINSNNIYENNQKSSYSFSKKHLKLSKLMRLRSNDYQFVSFITCILEYDPKKRLTPEQALFHPFLNSVFPFSLNMIQNIAISNTNNLKQEQEEIVYNNNNHLLSSPSKQHALIIPSSSTSPAVLYPQHQQQVSTNQIPTIPPIPSYHHSQEYSFSSSTSSSDQHHHGYVNSKSPNHVRLSSQQQQQQYESPKQRQQQEHVNTTSMMPSPSSSYQPSSKKIKLSQEPTSSGNTLSRIPNPLYQINQQQNNPIPPPSTRQPPSVIYSNSIYLPPTTPTSSSSSTSQIFINQPPSQLTPPPSIPSKKILPQAPPKRHACEKCGSPFIELSHAPNNYTIRCKNCRHIFVKNK